MLYLLKLEGLEGWHISNPLYSIAVLLITAGIALGAAALIGNLMKVQFTKAFAEDTGEENREIFYTLVGIIFLALAPLIWVLIQLILRGEAVTLGGI